MVSRVSWPMTPTSGSLEGYRPQSWATRPQGSWLRGFREKRVLGVRKESGRDKPFFLWSLNLTLEGTKSRPAEGSVPLEHREVDYTASHTFHLLWARRQEKRVAGLTVQPPRFGVGRTGPEPPAQHSPVSSRLLHPPPPPHTSLFIHLPVVMWELDYKESWVPNNWYFELWCWRRLESPLDCKEIPPVHPKGNQSWIFSGRTDAETEASILRPPDVKNWLSWKDPDVGKDWRQE